MSSGDEWGFSDEMPDPFETRELQNGYLNGAAGSPFSGYPDRSMFASQFSQYYRGNTHPLDLYHYNLPGGGALDTLSGSSGMDYGTLGGHRLSDFPLPDMSGLSVFSSDGLPMAHGVPMQQFTSAAGDTSSASGFGSFSSMPGGPPSLSAAFGSSFGSTVHSDRGTGTSNLPAGSGLPGAIMSHTGWQPDGTMSPKDLPIKRGSSPLSFKEQSPLLLFRDEEEEHDVTDTPAPKASPKTKQRKILPDKAPRSRRALQPKPTPTETTHAKAEKMAPSAASPQAKKPRPALPRKILPSPKMAIPRLARASRADDTPRISPSSSRSAKDDFLLTSKKNGMTYREIRAAGKFKEAESTLRGRYRTLTKRKEERVRRPEWSDKDIQLLRKAVGAYGQASETDPSVKVSWKEVAEYIYESGGTYLFGNSTCRKKWDELVRAEMSEE